MENLVKKRVNYIRILIAHVISLILLFTIVLAVDTAPPIINSINASPNPLNASNLLTITANVTDDVLVKTVLVEINGTNYSMKRIRVNDTLFSDDFESRNLSNWTTSGAGKAWNYSSANPFSGTSHIRAEPQNVGGSFIETNITTLGYTNIAFGFYAITTNLDAADTFQVDWNYGSGWVNLLTTHASGTDEFSGVTSYKFFGFRFNNSADNKNNISIRFACIAGGINEVCAVDNVTVTKNVVPQKAFFDDFESRNLSNWTTSGAGAAWTNSSANPFSGTSHIRAEPQNVGGSFIETNVTTLGYTNIDFSFYATTANLDAADTFQVDWNYGSGWVNLLTTHASGTDEFSGVTSYKFFGFRFNNSADNKNNISIRFACIAGAINEVCDVDNVTVTKIPFGDIWNFVYNTTGLSAGLHNYTVFANDSSGNSAVPARSNFTVTAVDTTLPIITGSLNKSINSILQNDTINATFNATDETSLSFGQVIVNSSGFNRIFNFTLSGTVAQFSQNFTINCPAGCVVNVTGRANDTSGNLRQTETIFTVSLVDTTKPAVILDKPDNNYYNDTDLYANVTFNGTAADNIELKNATLYHNASGIWKGNLSSILSGISAGFKFSLNLTNATFTWNVEACDAAGNCNFSATNRTVILNFTGIKNITLSVLSFTPANNSLNVSLKQDITATFNQDANDSTINNSTVIVKDSSNNTVRGKIKYFSSERKVRFNPHRFLKENETYTVNLTKNIKADNGTSLNSDFIWNFTTEIKDTDKDGIPDVDDIDDDGDGINDTIDFLKGNASHIKTDIVGLSIKVNDSTNISKKFDKKELVQFFINNSVIIELNFSFGQSTILDLTNISIQQNDNSSKGSIIINSLIVNATLKTFYLDNLSSFDGICIKDADIDAISDISNDCKSAFETFVACPGNAKNYDCSINGTRLKLTGLNHSAAQQANDNAPPRIDLMSISYSGTSTVSATLTVITDEDANCKFDAVDVSFGNMGSSMSGSGTQHTGSRSYSTDTSGTYYVLCRDSFGNTMSSSNSISFNADVTESSGSGTTGGGSGGGGGSFLNFSSCKENWVCDNWNECKNDFQTRKCFDSNNCGAKNQKPKEFQSCKKACEEIWQCSQWSICSDGISKRECYDLSECGTEDLKPSEYEECEFIAECYNLVQDQGEEGIDCGGVCPACETCFDRVQNQGEEGIDCGGPCRPCRTGDIITGKNILVFSETAPKANLIFIFVIVVVSLFLVFKGTHTFKDVINKSEEYRKDNKNEIVSKLKDKYGINKMKSLTLGKPKKIHAYEIKKGKIEEIKAKPYKTAATDSSKDKILNVLKEVHQNGR